MASEPVKTGVSFVIGAIDNILTELEERGIITGNMTYIKHGVRIGAAVGGLIANYTIARPGTTLDKVTSAIAISALPLAIHSIRSLLKSMFAYGSSAGYELVSPRTQVVYTPVTESVITPSTSRITSY